MSIPQNVVNELNNVGPTLLREGVYSVGPPDRFKVIWNNHVEYQHQISSGRIWAKGGAWLSQSAHVFINLVST